MNFVPENVYHVYNQGNNKQQIFFCDEDYLTFLRMTRKLILPNAEIIAYCLMPNHFHFMIATGERASTLMKQGGLLIDPLTNGFRKLLSGYTRIINTKYNRTGSIFRQKTKAKNLSEITIATAENNIQDYYLTCFNYIHSNPAKAEIVAAPEDWEYSSYKDYLELRKGTLCNKALGMSLCNLSAKDFISKRTSSIDEGLKNVIFGKDHI
jgi:putative transposase